MPFQARTVEIRNVGSVHEVLKTCTKDPRKPTTRANLARWRERNEFPKPFKVVGRRTELWDLAEVRAWWDAWQARRQEGDQ